MSTPITSELGPGRALPHGARARLEPVFGRGLGAVRVHDAPPAARVARDLGARAFSVGTDIAFARGAFAPSSPSGFHTLAHEVAHVVQASDTGERVIRRDLVGNAVLAAESPARELYLAARTALLAALDQPDRAAAQTLVLDALATTARAWSDDEAAQRLRARASRELDVTVPGPAGAATDAFAILARYAELDRRAGTDALITSGHSPGAELVVRELAEELAITIAPTIGALDPAWEVAGHIMYTAALARAVIGSSSTAAAYRHELEATFVTLVDARDALAGAIPANAASYRAAIAQLSRRVLLLQSAIDELQSDPSRAPGGDLAAQLAAAAGRIATIRDRSRAEADTRSDLGDRVELLAPTTFGNFTTPLLDQTPRETIAPEVALPATTDTATVAMLTTVSRAIAAARTSNATLHDRLVPREPRYALDEFAAVYRRWFAMFSPTRERQNPAFQAVFGQFDREAQLDLQTSGHWRTLPPDERARMLEHQPTVWELTGVPSGLGSVSGAGARAILLHVFVPMLEAALGHASGDDFAGEMPAAQGPPLTPQGGATTTSPNIDARARFAAPDGALLDAPQATAVMATSSARRFTEVALARAQSTAPRSNARDLERLTGRAARTARDPDAPLVGIHDVTAAEGWAFLVEVTNPEPGRDNEVVAREQRDMPLDVALYLMERRREAALAHGPFVPHLQGGAPIGDAAVRSRGLEATTGRNEARAAGRATTPAPHVTAMADSLRDARSARTPGASELVTDFERYIEGFFRARTGPEWRFAGVLTIANIEHGIAREVTAMFDPVRILTVAAEAAAMTAGMAILEALGPIGKIAAAGVHGYMAAHNCSPLASLTAVLLWMRNVAQVDNLRSARAWALLAQPVVADLQNLMDSVIMHAATQVAHVGLSAIKDSPPSTPRQLVEKMGQMARDPAARRPMLAAIHDKLGELGRAGQHGTPEYRLYEAMQVEVAGAERRGPVSAAVEAARDAPLIGRESPREALAQLGIVPRTREQRATLDAEVPSDLRSRVHVVEDPLLSGRTVQVRLGANEVRIHAGPEATAEDVRAHIDVARERSRFTGVRGRIRDVIDAARVRLTGIRSQHSRAREAELEIEKLNRMIMDLELRRDSIDERASAIEQPVGPREAAEIQERIDSLDAQIAMHARELGSFQPGRGFVAAVDSRATLRDALVRGGRSVAEADAMVRRARSAGQLDAMAQLVEAGTFARLTRAGVTVERISEILAEPDGYANLVRADLEPAGSRARRVLGARAARSLDESRVARVEVDRTTTAETRLRGEWGIDDQGRFTQRAGGLTEAQIRTRYRTATENTEPRILFRYRRYVERMGREPASFAAWAEAGFRANLNREGSAPFEEAAVRAVGALPNNDPIRGGGQQTYNYEEWVTEGGRAVESRAGRPQRPSGADDFAEATTRPDGIRPRTDRGFDVVEHKHLFRGTEVLDDSIQLRAQREMAVQMGHGRYELVMTSEAPLVNGQPPVRPSNVLGPAVTDNGAIYYFDGARVTHQWNARVVPARWDPVSR